jgi:hypothetical protein
VDDRFEVDGIRGVAESAIELLDGAAEPFVRNPADFALEPAIRSECVAHH